MDEHLRERFLQEITPHLSADDDPNFWVQAFDTVLYDIDALYPEKSKRQEVFLQIGACTHWLRPHQMRWTAAGGFAWPEGYLQKYRDHIKNSWGPIGSGLPEFEWFVLMHWDQESGGWQMVTPKFFGKRRLVFRAAFPTRTGRHQQAAVHTVWTPGTPKQPDEKVVRFYGFRKRNQEWECVAASN